MDKSYYSGRLVDQAPSMLAYWDKDLLCCFANRDYARWFGVDPDKLIGTSIKDLLGPKLYALNETYIQGALQGEEQNFERVITGPDGVKRHGLATYTPDMVNGQVAGFMVQVTDVSKLKNAEAALQAGEALMDRTGRIAGVGGWEVDLRANVVSWSDQTRRIHDVGPDYLPTVQSGIAFYAPQARQIIEAAVRESIDKGTPWDLELPFESASGRQLWVRTFGEVEFEDGVAVRLSGAIQDITEHRQRKAELQREQVLRAQSERHAQELDRLLSERSDMLDVLAHEVRQPLNNASAALQGAASALAEVGEQVASLRLTRAQTVMSQVLASIDNTLAVASLLAHPTPIQKADTDIDTLLAVSIADMPPGDRGRLSIERITATRTASMDMSLMRLALRNLLSNALKHSPPTSPVLIRVMDSDEPLALVIEVIDKGHGIQANLVPLLFQRDIHRQAGGGPSTHGLGLGLYIVRRVMELHGGEVQLVGNNADGVAMRLIMKQ
ncbi:PAS domain-containing protein [Aquabacterium sp.]|uniref:PAS domain-containing sensor histidine kinase n=1 Tax=Aquabacterium sp. TaxID=1872578 RepID=UPI0024895879|nr:PAS domain-containing protein [Aquabacterium sp.]MDI1258957.1 PAS domain-containing protein [Aquabacterium sp.]